MLSAERKWLGADSEDVDGRPPIIEGRAQVLGSATSLPVQARSGLTPIATNWIAKEAKDTKFWCCSKNEIMSGLSTIDFRGHKTNGLSASSPPIFANDWELKVGAPWLMEGGARKKGMECL